MSKELRTRPPFSYQSGTTDEEPVATVVRLHENALAALSEVIQHAAEYGAAAGIWWAIEYMENTDRGEDADFVAYENWKATVTPAEQAQIDAARLAAHEAMQAAIAAVRDGG